jgi:serine/threonine-protein kinase
MMTTDLGACEWFVWDLRRSNLIDRGQLDQIIGEFLSKNPGAEPPSLAEFLVAQGILTEFQAERLLQGKTQGFVLGPFTLMDALGTGSMGTVYKARSKNDNCWYAVKVLPRRSMWNVRIARRKVRAFEQIHHPGVVPFVDVGTAGGMHYLAWPMVEGTCLDKIVEQEGKLPAERAVLLAMQTAEALEQAHHHGLFHGLIKPSNLMLGPDGQVKILDFGIGCLLAETEGESLVDTMSTANSVNSGLDCASPESIMDPTNLNAIGDQYSLGCVLYFLLTGRFPFPDGTAVEKMMSHQHKQPTPIKDLAPNTPDELITVVERLMHKTPASRYADCGEILNVLRPFLTTGPTVRRTQSMRNLPKLDPNKLPARKDAPAAAGSQPGPRPVQPLPPRTPSGQGPAAPGAGQLPRPAGLPRPPLPSRSVPTSASQQTVHAGSSRSTLRSQPAPAPVPEPDEGPEPEEQAQQNEFPEDYAGGAVPPTLGQRLGTFGIVLLALLAGAAAWLATSFIKF